MPCIINKGSIAVDGVSMTIAALSEKWFEIALIPTPMWRRVLDWSFRPRMVRIRARKV